MNDYQKKNTSIEDSYQRAQVLMQGFWSHSIVPNANVFPTWIESSDCFWYEREIVTSHNLAEKDNNQTAGLSLARAPKKSEAPANAGMAGSTGGATLPEWGKEYRLVNACTASNVSAFDHGVLAIALAEVVGRTLRIDKDYLPITDVKMELEKVGSGEERTVDSSFYGI